jgi:hypothetical protein
VNVFLPSAYSELVYRLALGLEPRDAHRRARIARPLEIALDGVPAPTGRRRKLADLGASAGLSRLRRHSSNRWVLLYDPLVEGPVDVRLVPRDRRFVPRRLRVRITSLADVLTAEPTRSDLPAPSRVWRPLLFPGAAYDIHETATGVRGRVEQGGAPRRWTRVEARIGNVVIGRAHGDDRGEFLLVLGPTTNFGDLQPTVTVTIRVHGRNPAPAVDPDDPLADLPLERVALPGVAPDPVGEGRQLPIQYLQLAQRAGVALPIGRLTNLPPFVIP